MTACRVYRSTTPGGCTTDPNNPQKLWARAGLAAKRRQDRAHSLTDPVDKATQGRVTRVVGSQTQCGVRYVLRAR